MLLFSYLFLVIGSFVAGKATRDALFLFRFSARQLPYVDIAVAVLVGVWVAIYIRDRPACLGPHAHLPAASSSSPSNSLLFWYLSHFRDAPWVLPRRLRVGRACSASSRPPRSGRWPITSSPRARPSGSSGSSAAAPSRATSSAASSCSRPRRGSAPRARSIGMAVALLVCAVLVDRLWRLRHLAQSADPDDEDVREAAGPRPDRAPGERAADRRLPVPESHRRADPRVLVRHGRGGVAVQGHCRRGNQGQGRPDRVLRQLHLLHRPAVAALQWLADVAAAAAVRPGRGAVGRARGAGARIRGPARLGLARGGHPAPRQRPGAALFDRPAGGRAAVPAAPGGADAAGEVVHRHGGLAAGRRALRPGHPAARHGAALAGSADRAG